MKKIFTLLAGLLSVISGYASRPEIKSFPVEKLHINADRVADLQLEGQKRLLNPEASRDADYTRSWQDDDGNTWTLEISLVNEPLVDYFGFSSLENPVTFDDYPVYPALYTLRQWNHDNSAVITGFSGYLFWPTEYIAEQIFNFDGELNEESEIPVEFRDYSVVSPEVLFNKADGCRIFTDNGDLFPTLNSDYDGWDSWILYPNAILYNGQNGSVIRRTDDGENCFSTIDFESYEEEESYIVVNNNINFKIGNNGYHTLNKQFEGEAVVKGFIPTSKEVVLKDIHLFNGGAIVGKDFGDDNPFTVENFDSVTQFYLMALCEGMECMVIGDEDKIIPFDISKISYKITDSQAIDFNFFRGSIFGSYRFAQDTDLDPLGEFIHMFKLSRVYDKFLNRSYYEAYPEENTFLPYGYSFEWSNEYGLEVINESYYMPLTKAIDPMKQYITWGTPDGFSAHLESIYSETMNFSSNVDIVYHYDPSDMRKTRIFPSVGDFTVGVEEITSETAPVVAVVDGNVVVNAPAEAPIMVVTLDGKLVKAIEGKSAILDLPKGAYVIRVGETVTKVIL